VDKIIGKIVAKVEKQGLTEKTLIFLPATMAPPPA